ncbi:MAG TPA: SHOCT domain-containing protein [Jatrophihabitans sp.]|jgi:hypothetical protein
MPLLRGIARTAVIAGTATAVSNRVSRRQAGKWAKHDEQGEPEEQPAAPESQPAPAAPAAPQPSQTDSMLSQLKQLGDLHNSGVLSDAEFTAQKNKILGT